MYCRQYKNGSNYAYLVADEASGTAITVDPVLPEPILDDVRKNGFSLEYVFNTHGHHDHISGNREVLSATNARLCAHPAEGIGEEIALTDGMVLHAGKLSLGVVHTPGHTPGSVCIVVNDGLLFCGDTLFLAGCGNCSFGGNVRDLYDSFANKLSQLPDHLKVFPGHNYVHINLPFSRGLFPSSDSLRKKEEEISALALGVEPTSTIGEEKGYNPFFNFGNPALQKDFEKRTGKKVGLGFDLFRETRSLKDRS